MRPLHLAWMLCLVAVFGGAAFSEDEVSPPSASPVPSVESEPEDATAYIQDALALRDPFKRPESAVVRDTSPVSDLERFPTEQFKLVGVITGPGRYRAILQDPSGKTFFVMERMRIGTRRGVIRQIRPDAVVVREKVVNVLGKEEASDSEIKLPSEKPGGTGSSG